MDYKDGWTLEQAKEKYGDLLQSHHSLCGKIAELEDELKKSGLHNQAQQIVIGGLRADVGKLQGIADRANAAMLKHQKHNGALEIAVQEAHRDADAANRQIRAKDGYIADLEEQTRSLRGVVTEKSRLNSEAKEAIEATLTFLTFEQPNGNGDIAGLINKLYRVANKRKCSSTYSHGTHGKLTCEKDADHLNRVGDVEHYSRNVKWMSI